MLTSKYVGSLCVSDFAPALQGEVQCRFLCTVQCPLLHSRSPSSLNEKEYFSCLLDHFQPHLPSLHKYPIRKTHSFVCVHSFWNIVPFTYLALPFVCFIPVSQDASTDSFSPAVCLRGLDCPRETSRSFRFRSTTTTTPVDSPGRLLQPGKRQHGRAQRIWCAK